MLNVSQLDSSGKHGTFDFGTRIGYVKTTSTFFIGLKTTQILNLDIINGDVAIVIT